MKIQEKRDCITSFDIPTTSTDVGYIYNGLDYNIETGTNSFSMEGGLQVSH